jgi:FAD synthetase
MASNLYAWHPITPMKKTLSIAEAHTQSALAQKQNKKVVLAGGCFDILHIGHLRFLEEAKKEGDELWVLLESDETITKNKGDGRPINDQTDRAKLLAAMELVAHVVLLKPHMTNAEYDALIIAIKPAIIATTKGDLHRVHKERQAKLIGAQVKDVIENMHNQSTTKLIKIFHEL